MNAKTGGADSRRENVDGQARVSVSCAEMTALAEQVFLQLGCNADTSTMVASHLVEANLMGVESHGVMRLMQYVDQFESGYMRANATPELTKNENGALIVDGHSGIGMPAIHLAVEHACLVAGRQGMSVIAVVNCGHTGRLGAFVEVGAQAGCLTICVGGGGRKSWRQVAPYGGARGMLPTNPYAFGVPGGDRGAVVLDFATSKIAGGWVYAAHSAGHPLPNGAVIDADGNPTRDPADYFNGGAILSAGGAMGYGLGVIAELLGEALLGPVTTEMNWMVVCIDTKNYNTPSRYRSIAEDILHELRECPPAAGFERVEIPGERERERRQLNWSGGVSLPSRTWEQIEALATRLGLSPPNVV